ncbi:MAG: hypothetical protein ACI305_03300 [Lepagella sp.]
MKRILQLPWLMLALALAAGQLPARGDSTALLPVGDRSATVSHAQGFRGESSTAPRKPTRGIPTTPQAISGKYMAFGYTTASVSVHYWVDVQVAGNNTVTIKNLLNKGGTVTGTLDPASGVISIKPQVIFTDPEYGDFICYVADVDRKVYFRDRNLEFTLAADGSLNIGNWGAFVTSGDHAGAAMIRHREILYPAKGTMTDYSVTAADSLKVRSYPVVVVRENNNKLLIKNFYNYGADVVLTVDSTGKVLAPRTKLAMGTTSTGSTTNFYNYEVTDYVSPTSLKLKTTGVPGQWTGQRIELAMWALSSSTSTSGIYEILEKSVIEVPDAFVPFSSALSLKGAGTADSPYLIETPADLANLSQAVNYAGSYTVSKKAFNNIHFRQAADLDMSGVANFEPIGYAAASTFCGVYDGGGHVISGLRVDRRGEANAGLFGIVGKEGKILNLTIDKAIISSEGNNIGTIAADFQGYGSNLHAKASAVSTTGSYAGGLMGKFSGVIHNLSYSGTLHAGNYIGGIIGQGNGSLYNAVSYAEITVGKKSAIVGGIAGTLAGADTATIRNLHFDGSIRDSFGSTTIGGLTGFFQNATMTSGWFSGRIYSKSISTNTTIVGGLTGLLAGATISDCLSTGWVESPDAKTFGALVGVQRKRSGSGTDAPRLEKSLVNGMVKAPAGYEGEFYVGEHLETLTQSQLLCNSQLAVPTDTLTGIGINVLTSGDPPAQLASGNWQHSAGKYPLLKAFVTSDAATVAAAPFFLDDNDHVGSVKKDIRLSTGNGVEWFLLRDGAYVKTGHGLEIDGEYARLTATQVCNDTLVALKGDRFKIAFLKIQPKEYDGEGTTENPYLIRTADDIFKMRNAVDLQGMRYTDVYFRMANDIDFSGVENFIGFSSQGIDNAFNGHFDGAGHRIMNWRIDRAGLVDGRPSVSGANQLMAGFFLYTGPQAVISNVVMDESCFIQAGSHVAALVSQNGGTVQDCRNYAHVRGLFNETGGLVASNAADATIRDCFNGGMVEGGRTIVGGIVGANLGKVEGCQNDGIVVNDSLSTLSPAPHIMGSTGGIAGYNFGTMTDCLGAGEVRGPASVGALIGVNRTGGKVSNSLVTGILHDALDPDRHGALMGAQENITDTVSNLYFDSQLSATTAAMHGSLPGIAPLSTAQLVGGTLPEGLSADRWSAVAGRYPVLKKFSDNELSLFNASCYLIADTTGGRTDSRFYLRRGAAIAKTQQAAATLALGRLSILSGSLTIPAGARQLSDTLVFASGSMTKHIPLFVPGALLSVGDGSAQNPYIIANADDWNRVARTAADHRLNYRDEHFRLSADISFASTPMQSVCADGVTRFQGHLDGAGHVIDEVALERTTSAEGGLNLAPVGILGEYGEIRNLTLGAASRISGHTYVGGIAGQNAGLIQGCVNLAPISAANTYSGGMAGYVITGGRFIDCVNFGKVTVSQGQAGGIAGGNGSDIGGLALRCSNHGDILSEDRSAGGIIGSGRIDVRNCFNDGTVRALNVYAGGIVGYFTYRLTVDSCVNQGPVTADNGSAGGIVGFMFSAGNVTRCINRGDISSAKTWAGGIIGNTYKENTLVADCHNYGSVSAATTHAGGIAGNLVQGTDTLNMNILRRVTNHGTVTAGTNYAGGIVGEAKSFTRIFDARNYGDVNGSIYVGGVAGCMLGKADTLFNSGAVTAQRYTVGGLIGTTNAAVAATAAVSNGLNIGSVRSLGTTATTFYNVGGILGGGNIKMYDCVNTADVQGYKSVGGLVGLSVKGSSSSSGLYHGTSIYNSLNLGSVTCLADDNAATCGHIAGSSTTPLSYVIYSNNYFDRQYAGREAFPADTAGTAMLTRQLSASDLGAAWTEDDSQAYPVPRAFVGTDEGKLAAAALIIKDEQTRHGISRSCRLYAPQGVEWSAPGFTVRDGKLTWSGLNVGQTYTLMACIGDMKRPFSLTVDATTGSIDIETDSADTPVTTEWYTTDGLRIASPQRGTMAVRVIRYASGRVDRATVIVP